MHHRAILAAVLLASGVLAVPQRRDNSTATIAESPSQTSSAPASSLTAGLTSNDPNDSFFEEFQDEIPEPVRGSLGAPSLGPQNIPLDR